MFPSLAIKNFNSDISDDVGVVLDRRWSKHCGGVFCSVICGPLVLPYAPDDSHERKSLQPVILFYNLAVLSVHSHSPAPSPSVPPVGRAATGVATREGNLFNCVGATW